MSFALFAALLEKAVNFSQGVLCYGSVLTLPEEYRVNVVVLKEQNYHRLKLQRWLNCDKCFVKAWIFVTRKRNGKVTSFRKTFHFLWILKYR